MCELASILNCLCNSIMFRLSLESSELFHSNFLAWVFETYPKQCSEIFNIEIPQNNDENNYIKREKNIGENDNNKKCIADIYIKSGNSEIIIENKFKSFPYKEQLDDYIKLNQNCKIILMSYYEPYFDKNGYIFWSYKDVKDNLEKLAKQIEDKDNKFFIEKYIEMADLLLKLKDIISLKKNKKTYSENYLQIKNVKDIADKMNFYKFLQKTTFNQLGNDLKKDIKNIDWIHVDVSRNQNVFLDIMVNYNNDNYKKAGIKSLGITFSEDESTIRHHMGIESIKNETRQDIENELINTTSERYKLLEWFFRGCKGKGTDKKYFYGFDCIKNQGCCWLYKKTETRFDDMDYESIKELVQTEIKNITDKQ